MKKQFLQKLESTLKDLSIKRHGPKSLLIPEDYINSEDPSMTYLKLRIPQVRGHLKEIVTDFKVQKVAFDQQFEIMEHVWFHAVSFEARAIALFWLEDQKPENLLGYIKNLTTWVDRIGNWAHSDSYASTLARLFEFDPSSLQPTFEKWNKHKNQWRRRNSLVGLMLYAKLRKKHPPFQLCKSMIETQLEAPEYYVQKAVGWTLRETYTVYPKMTYAYIEKNISRITSVAWVATSERMTTKEKSTLLRKRKSERNREK